MKMLDISTVHLQQVIKETIASSYPVIVTIRVRSIVFSPVSVSMWTILILMEDFTSSVTK